MAKLDIDWSFFDEMTRADSDPDAAARALMVIAGRLRSRDELTSDIVEYLAGAIEASMQKPQKMRGSALLRELKLTAGNRRPAKADSYEIGRAFNELMDQGQSQNSAASDIAARSKISESTAVRMWKNYLKAEKERQDFDSRCNRECEDEG